METRLHTVYSPCDYEERSFVDLSSSRALACSDAVKLLDPSRNRLQYQL